MSPVKLQEKKKQPGEIKLVNCFLTDFLPNCETVQLFSSSSYSSQAPIGDLYVSMPTNICIDVSIEQGEVVEIVEKANEVDELFENYAGRNAAPRVYGQEQKNIIIDALRNFVKCGKEYFYPELLDRPLVISPPWTDGVKENYWVLNVCDIASLYDRVILLGGPGSGKSTSLRYLTSRLIRNFLGLPFEVDESLSNILFDQRFVPIYIEIRDFSNWLSIEQRVCIDLKDLRDYIFSLFKRDELSNNADAFWIEIKQQHVIFLFDGLDEAYSDDENYRITQEKLRGLTAQLSSEFSSLKILFSSRIGEYVDYQLYDYKTVKLVSMHQYKSRELIQKIYNYHSIPISSEQISSFLHEMSEKKLKEDISGNPLLLSLIVAIAMNTEGNNFSLPKQKSQILYEGIKLLIDRWYTNQERPDFFKKYTDDEILAKLKHFAYGTNENGLIALGDLFEFIQTDKENANDILDYLVKRAGLIIKKGKDYEFAHKSFRSYLAASYIVESVECTKYLTTNNRERFKKQREESILVVDILFDTIKEEESNDGSLSQLWSILNLLVYAKNHNEWDIWLAGKIISRRGFLLLNIDFPLRTIVIEELKKLLLNVFEKRGIFSNQDLDVVKRLECGAILGQLGDPRCGVGIKNDLPQIVWCTVDSGEFIYGTEDVDIQKIVKTEWGKNCIFKRETPAKPVYVESFDISMYPITVSQFRSFLTADDGYYSESWYQWSPVAKQFYVEHIIKEKFVFPEGYDIGNYPATNISFIEAVAFCKWFSEKICETIRLPSEVEWEYVAKKNKSLFIWGNEFRMDMCNSLPSGIGHICSVGGFYRDIKDDSQPIDLCGNTWEWTQSFYTESHDNDFKNTIINTNENELMSKEFLVADKGGSYLNGPNCLRVSFRGRDPVNKRADRFSFRVVREISPFSGMVLNKPDVNQEYVTDSTKLFERTGYGPEVKKGDVIQIWYHVYKNGVSVQQGTCKFKLGSKKIHSLIEKELYNKRVAAFFNIELSGCDCFGNNIFGKVKPNDKLNFDISIMDIFD